MLQGIPHKILPAGQNKCPARENFKFPADRDGIHPRSLGEAAACPYHGMDKWLVLQSFYNGLTLTSRAHIDASAGGSFLDLTITKAKALVEKMVSN